MNLNYAKIFIKEYDVKSIDICCPTRKTQKCDKQNTKSVTRKMQKPFFN